jgi:hypothetical protein
MYARVVDPQNAGRLPETQWSFESKRIIGS